MGIFKCVEVLLSVPGVEYDVEEAHRSARLVDTKKTRYLLTF
jgi:hypothetical protein